MTSGPKRFELKEEHSLVQEIFGSEAYLSEEAWKHKVRDILGAKDEDINIIYPHIEQKQKASKERFSRFLSWFNPIATESSTKPNTFKLSQIASLFSQPYFHGGLYGDPGALYLASQPYGTFLVRFAGNAPHFSIDVKVKTLQNQALIDRWKIYRKPDSTEYVIENKPFKRVEDVVKHYEVNELKDTGSLKRPCPRPPQPIGSDYPIVEQIEDNLTVQTMLAAFFGAQTPKMFGYLLAGQRQNVMGLQVINKSRMFWVDYKKFRTLSHPNVLTYKGIFETNQGPPLLLYEFVSLTLMDLVERRLPEFPFENATKILKEVIIGMSYLAQKQISNALLNLYTVFLQKKSDGLYHGKVGMYGLNQLLCPNDETDNKQFVFPEEWKRWIAPETYDDRPTILSSTSEIWSFGMMLYSVIEQQVALKDIPLSNIGDIFIAKRRDDLFKNLKIERMKYWDFKGVNFRNILLLCLNFEPQQRPSWEVLEEKFEPLDPDDPESIKDILIDMRKNNTLKPFSYKTAMRNWFVDIGINSSEDLYYLKKSDTGCPLTQDSDWNEFRRGILEHLVGNWAKKGKEGVKKWFEMNSLDLNMCQKMFEIDMVSSLEDISAVDEGDMIDNNITSPQSTPLNDFLQARTELKQLNLSRK